MASVLHRTTLEFRRSVNTPDYDVADWIINPDLSAVRGQPVKYWQVSGDTVSLKDQAGRDAADAAELESSRDGLAAQLDQQEDILRACMLLLLDELNAHAATITAILDAADGASNLAGFKAAMAAIGDLPPRTPRQLLTAIRNKLGS